MSTRTFAGSAKCSNASSEMITSNCLSGASSPKVHAASTRFAAGRARARRSRRILPVLGDDDQGLVIPACASGAVCARDAAITLLALSTGLRACDIVALRLADVDWRGQTIGIVQQKTGNPLTLPLPALVMGGLAGVLSATPAADYRPATTGAASGSRN